MTSERSGLAPQRGGAVGRVDSFALLSSLSAIANPRRAREAKTSAFSREVRAAAFDHLYSHFKKRNHLQYASGVAVLLGTPKATPSDLIAALGVLVNPNAEAGDKKTALDMLAAHFDPMIEAQSKADERAAKVKGALEQLQALKLRAEKLEKASTVRAVGQGSLRKATAPRRPQSPKDSVVEEIERIERNFMRSLGKDVRPVPATSTDWIERAGQSTLGNSRKCP